MTSKHLTLGEAKQIITVCGNAFQVWQETDDGEMEVIPEYYQSDDLWVKAVITGEPDGVEIIVIY